MNIKAHRVFAIRPNGIVKAALVQGPKGNDGKQGIQGETGADFQPYIHEQANPSTVWTIVHNLGALPDVIVFDTAGSEVEGAVDNPDFNTTILTFSAAFGGSARLS